MPQTISEDLAATLELYPNIDTVYFTKRGEHYFNIHPLGNKKYGRLGIEQVQASVQGDRVFMKNKNKAIPECEITEEIPARDILARFAKQNLAPKTN